MRWRDSMYLSRGSQKVIIFILLSRIRGIQKSKMTELRAKENKKILRFFCPGHGRQKMTELRERKSKKGHQIAKHADWTWCLQGEKYKIWPWGAELLNPTLVCVCVRLYTKWKFIACMVLLILKKCWFGITEQIEAIIRRAIVNSIKINSIWLI